MSRVLTGDKLIKSVRQRAMIPDDTSVYTDQDILDVANEEMDVNLLDKLLAIHAEHLVFSLDVAKNSSGVYEIPTRAIGNKLRDVSLVVGNQLYELTQIGIGDLSDYDLNDGINTSLDKFYIEGNMIKLVKPTVSYSHIRFHFYLRPNVLTKLDKCGIVQSFTRVDNTYTINLDKIPADFFKPTTPSLKFDIVDYKTPNRIKDMDITGSFSAINNTATVVFNGDLQLNIGDYFCIAEQSPVPNIPTELHPTLAQLAAVHILESTGDTEALKNAQTRLDLMMRNVQQLVDDRVELAPRKIVPRHGVLRESAKTISGKSRRGMR